MAARLLNIRRTPKRIPRSENAKPRVFWRSVVFALGLAAIACGCVTLPEGEDLPPAPVVDVSSSSRPTPIQRPGAPRAETPMPTVPPPAYPDPPSLPRAVRPTPVREAVDLPPAISSIDAARVQIWLDRANFSPGPIDGRWGPNSRAALREWQQHAGLPVTGMLDAELLSRVPPEAETFTTHVVTDAEHAALRPFPKGWRERAALDAHGYETILEAIAERYHASERFIRELNPALDWPNPPAGSIVRVPRVRPYARGTAARIEITLSEKILRVYDATNRLIARFPCSIAKRVEKRPVGEFRIINAAEFPNYTFDPDLFREDPEAAGIGRRLIIPPGPNNPVGVVWLGLDRPGYGIHGTPFPEEIGKTESHGCFRLANWNARKLLDMIRIGIPVVVYP